MSLQLCMYGNPVLRKKAKPVEVIDASVRETAEEMLRAMYAENGLGLAAEQVGLELAMCVIDIPEQADMDEHGVPQNPSVIMPLVLINPEIVSKSDEKELKEEGCLSFPGIYAPVERSRETTIRYLDREGKEQNLSARDLLARAIQHEIDHLNGVLMIDRVSQIKKISLSGKLKRLSKETKAQLG